MSLDNSLLVACGDVVVVAAVRNVSTTGDVAAVVVVVDVDDVVVVVGVVAAVVVWVQRCWMRPYTSPRCHFVSVVVTIMGKELSWWYRQTT